MSSAWNDVFMNNYGTPPLTLVRGSGCYVTDDSGQDFLDMFAGIAVNALGHAHPRIVKAVGEQVATLGHTSNIFANDQAVAVARELQRRFGHDDARVLFCNSGAEANEAAFKIARLTGKNRVLAAHHGFHGRTMGSLALTGQPSKRRPFMPLAGGVEFYPYGDSDYLAQLVEQDPDDVAAIFLEPIQGETGVIPAPDGFLADVRALCDKHDILMVVDEVQTGVGRTGSFFAFEQADIVPDVVTMAKGLGGGLPVGAVIARGRAGQLFQPGQHGTTFGGNPVVLAAASAVLEAVDDELLRHVTESGDYLKEKLHGLHHVTGVRGRGLLLGIALDQPCASELVSAGLKRGVLLNAPNPQTIRLAPPLIIERSELDIFCEIFTELLADVASSNATNN